MSLSLDEVRGPRLEELRSRYVSYYEELAKAAVEGSQGHDQKHWWKVLEDEYDNLSAAFEWAATAGRGEEGLALALAIFVAWTRRGDPDTGAAWLRRALELPSDASETKIEAMLRLAEIAWPAYDDEVARTWAEESLQMARALGSKKMEGRALSAVALMSIGNEESLDLLRDSTEGAVALAKQTHDDLGTVEALTSRGRYLIQIDDLEGARAALSDALEVARQRGDRVRVVRALMWLSGSASDDRAEALLQEAREIATELGDEVTSIQVADQLGARMLEGDDPWSAIRMFEEFLERLRAPSRRWPLRRGEWSALMNLSTGLLDLNEPERALAYARQAYEAAQSRGEKVISETALGAAEALMGDWAAGYRRLEKAAIEGKEIDPLAAGQMVLGHLAVSAMASHRLEIARAALVERLNLTTTAAVAVHSKALMATVDLLEGKLDAARSGLEEATELWTQLGATMFGNRARWRLASVLRRQGQNGAARGLITSVVSELWAHRDRRLLLEAMEVAGAIVAEDEPETGAWIIGAVERDREEKRLAARPHLQALREQEIAAVRQAAGESFERALAAGRELSLEEAVNHVLGPVLETGANG